MINDSNAPNVVAGTLYIVATPIGNLADFSERAKITLSSVDGIAAEDTRHSRPLLDHFGIHASMVALHDHNETYALQAIVEKLQAGEDWALISDAGTPLISDPGYRLVDAAQQVGVKVCPIPGASAVTAALSIAGLPTDAFGFYGFLPHKAVARQKKIQELAAVKHTWVVFESSHRIVYTVADLAEILPDDRRCFLARELTKKFEQTKRGTAAELQEWLAADSNRQRGEFVLVIAGAPESSESDLPADVKRVAEVLNAELPTKQAAKLAAEITHGKRNALYKYLLNEA